MMRWLRQHRYALRVALIRLGARPLSSIANIIVLALALAVPFIGWSLLLSTQPLAQHIPLATELTVFVQAQATPAERQQFDQLLQNDLGTWVADFEFISQEQALAGLKDNPSWAAALNVLEDNPLPDAYIIQLAGPDDAQEQLPQLITTLEAQPIVEQVLVDIEWLEKLDTLLSFAQQALFFLSLGVILIVIGTVFNTIRLQALNHQEEITVARLVGATEDFVRRPFLYFGALMGLAASLLALLMGGVALGFFATTFDRIASSYHIHLDVHTPDYLSLLLALLVVVIVAALAARWSVGKHHTYPL